MRSAMCARKTLDVGPFGSEFDLVIENSGRIRCATQLLGKHNIMNVLGCAAVAHALGLSLEQIAAGVAKAEPWSIGCN